VVDWQANPPEPLPPAPEPAPTPVPPVPTPVPLPDVPDLDPPLVLDPLIPAGLAIVPVQAERPTMKQADTNACALVVRLADVVRFMGAL
jgi:hypothetical protein